MMSPDIKENASQLYQRCRTDGLDLIAAIRIIRATYNLEFIEAKEIACLADTGQTLETHQADLAAAIEAVAAQGKDEVQHR